MQAAISEHQLQISDSSVGFDVIGPENQFIRSNGSLESQLKVAIITESCFMRWHPRIKMGRKTLYTSIRGAFNKRKTEKQKYIAKIKISLYTYKPHANYAGSGTVITLSKFWRICNTKLLLTAC